MNLLSHNLIDSPHEPIIENAVVETGTWRTSCNYRMMHKQINTVALLTLSEVRLMDSCFRNDKEPKNVVAFSYI